MSRFIGIDLAWQSEKNNTAVVVADGDQEGASVVACVPRIRSLHEVVDSVCAHADANAVVAVDAPLVIRNRDGRRPCETLISRQFGSYHAGAHSSNLTLYPEPKSVELVRLLEGQGFEHGPLPHLGRGRDGRWLFEVYPHPASVRLFALDRIVRYKRKRGMSIADQKQGLERFRGLLRSLADSTPPFSAGVAGREALFDVDIATLRGGTTKAFEDLLDAYFCAYLAYRYWILGVEGNELFGDMETGYIVVPRGGDARVNR